MNSKCDIAGFLRCPVAVCLFVTAISFFALAAAFISEAFGLEPCILCIYQRYPYAAVIFLGLGGLVMRKKPKVVSLLLALCALAFITNSGIALYHTGIERHWWKSAVEACSIFESTDKEQSVLENILSAPMGHCDEIPWEDPVFGLSMANYNVVLCFVLFLFCCAAAVRIRKSPVQSSEPSQL